MLFRFIEHIQCATLLNCTTSSLQLNRSKDSLRVDALSAGFDLSAAEAPNLLASAVPWVEKLSFEHGRGIHWS